MSIHINNNNHSRDWQQMSDEEMYAEYQIWLKEQVAIEKKMISELEDWVSKGNKVKGKTLEAHYANMIAEKKQKLVNKVVLNLGREKNGPNAKGKKQNENENENAQTTIQGLGKRASRNAKKKEIDIVVKPKKTLVQIEDLIGILEEEPIAPEEEEEKVEILFSQIKVPEKEKKKPLEIKEKEEKKEEKKEKKKEEKKQKNKLHLAEFLKQEKQEKQEKPEMKDKIFICRYILKNEKCPIDNCMYAHNLCELKPQICKFYRCKHVFQKGAQYVNTDASVRVCPFIHKDESLECYGRRMGLKIVLKTEERTLQKQVQRPVERTLQTPVQTPVQKQVQKKCRYFCKYVKSGERCPHRKCDYAHKVEELELTECRYAYCRCVKEVSRGVFVNTGDRICPYLHREETINSYGLRNGLIKKR